MQGFALPDIHSAVNYRGTRSELAVGRAITEGIKQGFITREQVVVCTKGGYLTFGTERPADPRRWIQETYVKSGLFKWEDFIAGCHCMTPAYIKNQVTPRKGIQSLLSYSRCFLY